MDVGTVSGKVYPLKGNQADAVEPRDSVWLSASAGTGKTQVLSARVLRLLLTPGVQPDQILCLTFTKAGAAEMATRVNDVLARWVRLPDTELAAELGAIRASMVPQTVARARSLFAAVLDCPKPTVTQIQGICMGGGLGLALNCDVRICASNAKFRMPAGRLGLGYAFDGVKRFTEVVGVSHTADLFFSARIFDATEALGMGLVKQVVDAPDLAQTVNDYAHSVTLNAPLTLAAAKRALLELRKNPEQRDMALVQSMVAACLSR
mgnify:CR=1 FL=1